MRRFPSFLLASLFLGGCGGVTSMAPASEDDATTLPDVRLVGFWRVDKEASAPGDAAKQDPPPGEFLLVIGRKPGSEREMEGCLVGLADGERLQVDRVEVVRTTRIGDLRYASLKERAEATPKPPARSGAFDGPAVTPEDLPRDGWSLFRYEIPDPSTLHVWWMDEKAVADDVREESVPGVVQTGQPAKLGDEPLLVVTLEADTAALREYLARRGDAIFRQDRRLVLRRVTFD